MANIITVIRIVCSISLLFCPVFSPVFYLLYIVAGVSDILDGIVARVTDTVSEIGSRLDTIADFIFVAVCLIKLLPVLCIESWMYIWVIVIAAIKVFNVVWYYTKEKKIVAVHSVLNKVTGALLFALPLTIRFADLRFSVIIVCVVATVAAVREGYIIRTGRA